MKAIMLVAVAITLFVSPLWAQRHATIKEMDYPKDADGKKGAVVLHLKVSPQGDVVDVVPSSGADPDLAKAAVANIKEWKFAAKNGKDPEDVQVVYMFIFQPTHAKMTFDHDTGIAVVTGVK
jgi:TonB family protein